MNVVTLGLKAEHLPFHQQMLTFLCLQVPQLTKKLYFCNFSQYMVVVAEPALN